MPRRPVVPKEPKPYLYDSVAECEDPTNATQGYHQVRPRVWPPSTRGNPDGSMSTRCEHCNCHVIVYGDNDEEQSGVKIIRPDKTKKLEAATK
jgi:hypothetical protein